MSDITSTLPSFDSTPTYRKYLTKMPVINQTMLKKICNVLTVLQMQLAIVVSPTTTVMFFSIKHFSSAYLIGTNGFLNFDSNCDPL